MKNLVLAILAISLSGCTLIGPGNRGVRITLGEASKEPKEPGVYLWVPFVVGMEKMNVQIQLSNVDTSSASKDMQEIATRLAVNWSIDPARVVDIYQKIGDEDDINRRIIIPAVNEVAKAASAKRTAEEILTKRLELKQDIDDGLKDRLQKNGIAFHEVSITNLSFSQDFSHAIEKKQIAEQEAKQAEYVALKATQEAKAEIEKAKGQAESQKLIKGSITSEVLQKMAIEKWNGSFPQVMGSGTLPLVNLKIDKAAGQ